MLKVNNRSSSRQSESNVLGIPQVSEDAQRIVFGARPHRTTNGGEGLCDGNVESGQSGPLKPENPPMRHHICADR